MMIDHGFFASEADRNRLVDALSGAGFRIGTEYGNWSDPGYEVSFHTRATWNRRVKMDVFTVGWDGDQAFSHVGCLFFLGRGYVAISFSSQSGVDRFPSTKSANDCAIAASWIECSRAIGVRDGTSRRIYSSGGGGGGG